MKGNFDKSEISPIVAANAYLSLASTSSFLTHYTDKNWRILKILLGIDYELGYQKNWNNFNSLMFAYLGLRLHYAIK